MAGNEERRTDQCERSCRECLEARFVDIMHEHVPCLCVLQLRCACSVHMSWCAHMCICASRARSQHVQSDTPLSQSQSREDVFLSSRSDVCQELKSSEADLHTTSHSQSKHDTSRGFNGQ